MNWKPSNEKMIAGYEAFEEERTKEACLLWLEAWESMKSLMAEEGIASVDALQKSRKWSDFPMNMVQDLEMELRNVAKEAGDDAEKWHRKRIAYCEELIPRLRPDDGLTIGNTRRAIAEAHADLGDFETAERLLDGWLTDDPNWGWGRIAKADLYLFRENRSDSDLAKAVELLKAALANTAITDREDVLERLGDACGASGDAVNMERFYRESETLREATADKRRDAELSAVLPKTQPKPASPHVHGPNCNHGHDHDHALSPAMDLLFPGQVQTYEMKPGRNDPCPCGSGKKYKKCCGA